MKYKIGIDAAARCSLIGSLTMAIVVADHGFWRKFSNLGIKDSKLLTHDKIREIVSKTNRHLKHFHLYYIKPHHMENKNLNDLEAEGTVNLLNTYKDFWEHNIYIDLVDPTREMFTERMERYFKGSLKKKIVRVMDKWTIEHHEGDKYKITSLAGIYAKATSLDEFNQIRKVWGSFGSGRNTDPETLKFMIEHPDCVHIRNSDISWRRLQIPELKQEILNRINNNTFKASELAELDKKYGVK